MAADSSSTSGFLSLVRVAASLLAGIAVGGEAIGQEPASSPPGSSQEQSHEAGPPRRIPRQQALTTAALDGTVREQVSDSAGRPIGGARVQIPKLQTGQVNTTLATGEGDFRVRLLPPGGYELPAEAEGYESLTISSPSLSTTQPV